MGVATYKFKIKKSKNALCKRVDVAIVSSAIVSSAIVSWS